MGWAAGDVSLMAYIQSSVPPDKPNSRISSLGAVMSCMKPRLSTPCDAHLTDMQDLTVLYSTYIAIFAVMTPALGKYADDSSSDGAHATIFNLGGVQFSVISAVLLASTFVPAGSWSLNPKLERTGVVNEDGGDNGEGAKMTDTAKEGRGDPSPLQHSECGPEGEIEGMSDKSATRIETEDWVPKRR
jgi:hypothetical protein